MPVFADTVRTLAGEHPDLALELTGPWPPYSFATVEEQPDNRGDGVTTSTRAPAPPPSRWEQVALVDLLDRLLATGVVVSGDITLSIAGVDLVYVSLHALISSVRAGGPGPVRATGAVRPGGRHD